MKRTILITAVILISLIIGEAVQAQQLRVAVTDTTTLSAPGYSAAVWCGGRYSKLLWFFTIASIDTKVSVALQARNGDSGWVNIFADSLGYTANGSYGLEWENVALADSVRFRFIAESGGTGALITQNVALSGGN
jgi:hypothetical protein